MVRIIAQSQFDVNEEIIEGAVLIGASTENRMVSILPDERLCISEYGSMY